MFHDIFSLSFLTLQLREEALLVTKSKLCLEYFNLHTHFNQGSIHEYLGQTIISSVKKTKKTKGQYK